MYSIPRKWLFDGGSDMDLCKSDENMMILMVKEASDQQKSTEAIHGTSKGINPEA